MNTLTHELHNRKMQQVNAKDKTPTDEQADYAEKVEYFWPNIVTF